MRRRNTLLIAFAVVMLLTVASSAFAIFSSSASFPKPDGYQIFQMQQGWWNGKLTWFIYTETNNIRFSQTHAAPFLYKDGPQQFVQNGVRYFFFNPYVNGLTLDYQLTSAVTPGDCPDAANPVGFVVNSNCNQAPIFSTSPTSDSTEFPYSGLWKAYFIKWRAGAQIVSLRSWADVLARVGTDLDISNVYGETAIDEDAGWVVIDAPILAVGPLGGPWYPASPCDPDNYRIKQGIVFNCNFKNETSTQSGSNSYYQNYTYTKLIALPTWFVFVANDITKKVKVAQVILPDIWDPDGPGTLADKLGATLAPGLQYMPESDTQRFLEIFKGADGSEAPLFQLPVLDQLPYTAATPPLAYYLPGRILPPCFNFSLYDPFSWRNQNYAYSAVTLHYLVNKVFTGDPLEDDCFRASVLDNSATIDLLADEGGLQLVRTGAVFNSPVVPPVFDYGFPYATIPWFGPTAKP
ncbi:MAG: hypothetical protein ABFD54_09885 [Armatimonadota bacterium]